MTTSGTPGSSDEQTAWIVRQAFAEEAATVRTDPAALDRIQRRTADTPRRLAGFRAGRRTRSVLTIGGAGVATVAVIALSINLVNRSGPQQPPAAHSGGGVAHGLHDGVSSLGAGPTADITYLGRPNPTVRLYVEQHHVANRGPLAAVRVFLTAAPIDPSYRTGWPEGVTCRRISSTSRLTTFHLAGSVGLATNSGLSRRGARLAIQALLRTAGGVRSATFTYNGHPLRRLFGVDVSTPVTVLDDSTVRALVNITNVSDGQTLTNPVSVKGTGNVFEANLNWVLARAGHPVARGYTSTGTLDTWQPFRIPLGRLRPGTYTIRCFESSPANGTQQFMDDKVFTIR